MGAALKGLKGGLRDILPGLVITSDVRKMAMTVFSYGTREAVFLMHEAMEALSRKQFDVASAKAMGLAAVAGKLSTKFGSKDEAIKIFMMANYIDSMAVARKKAAARVKKSSSLLGLAFKLSKERMRSAILSR